MKKYFVIGNPINHSLSPTLHNFWFREYNLNAQYDKLLLEKTDLNTIIQKVKTGEISGLNVTVPFKQTIIPFIEKLSPESRNTQSVNTVYLENDQLVGHNTDIAGFELAIRHIKFDTSNKNVLILGAGGVVPSIVCALQNLKTKNISIMNRTKEKAKKIKEKLEYVEIIDWGHIRDFDMIINATSIGLNKGDDIGLKFESIKKKILFYDLIYNPNETDFLKNAKKMMHSVENGKMMFIYQAHQSFTLWHKVMPSIDNETIEILGG